MMKTNILDVDMQRISIRSPKKIDESYLCKVDYDQSKLDVMFENVKIIKIKMVGPNSFYLYIKPSKDILNKVVDLEEFFVQSAQASCNKWFQKKLQPELIEEYFQTSAAVCKKNGNILKIRINEMMPEWDTEDGLLYNLSLRLHSIKFFKQSFTIVWNFIDAVVQDPECKFLETEEDVDDMFSEDEAFIGPSEEELEDIVVALYNKVLSISERAERTIQEMNWVKEKASDYSERLRLAKNKLSMKELHEIDSWVRDNDE